MTTTPVSALLCLLEGAAARAVPNIWCLLHCATKRVPSFRIQKSDNHRRIEVGKALWVHLVQLLLQQGNTEQSAQAYVYTDSDH